MQSESNPYTDNQSLSNSSIGSASLIETEIEDYSPWQVPPLDGESIASYLYRLRYQNNVSAPSSFSEGLGLGVVLTRWEKFRFNWFPTQQELSLLSDFSGVSVERLAEMLPPEQERKRFIRDTIRLCAACCVEAPYHRLKWQYNSVAGCEHHRLRLASKCPGCERPFKIASSLWVEKKCECSMPFKKMVKHQKKY